MRKCNLVGVVRMAEPDRANPAARSPPNMDRRFFARDHRCIVGVAADERRDLNAGNSHERVQVLPPESAFASAHGSIAAPSTKNHQAYPLISKRITIHCCCGSFVALPRLKDPVTGPQPFLPVRLGLPFGRLSYQSSPLSPTDNATGRLQCNRGHLGKKLRWLARQNHHPRSDLYAAVEVGHIFIGEPNAAR